MQFPNNLTEFNSLLLKVPQQKTAKVICGLLLVYVAFLAAKITWLLLDNTTNVPVTIELPSNNNQTTEAINLSPIKQLNLFGDYNKVAQAPKAELEQIEDAPETKLNLTLTGAVASNSSKTSAAVIANNGKQETYGIDEQITGTRATLSKVFHDRVLIKVNGQLETLMLDGFKYQKNANANTNNTRAPVKPAIRSTTTQSSFTTPNILDQRDNESLSESAQQFKDDIKEDPGKITDYLSISPKRQGGTIVGYSLMPGMNGEFFNASGLKAGDVAVQINGYDLTVPSNAAQALQELREQSEVSLIVDRNGDITEILFSIN